VSLSGFAGLNFGALLAAIGIGSPVLGLRPWRAGRSATVNDPKPLIAISSPRPRAAEIASKTASSALSAVPLGRLALLAMWAVSPTASEMGASQGYHEDILIMRIIQCRLTH